MTRGRAAPGVEDRLVRANLDALGRGHVLAVDLGRTTLEDLRSRCEVVAMHTDLREADGPSFAAWVREPGPFDSAIVAMPKERERLRMLLAMTASVLAPGGSLALAGRNDAGVRSAGDELAEVAADVRVADARAHGRLLMGTVPAPAPASLDDWAARFELTVGGTTLQVVSFPGVFAHGRLDEGTGMLLDALDAPTSARALDVGCGSGVVAAWLAARGMDVVASDVDALALAATERTFEASGLRARVVASDLFAEAPGPFDLIVTNPPFHRGVRTTAAITERLIRDAPEHLASGGALWMVANRHLPYTRALRSAFGDVDVVAQDGRYRVWRARSRPAGTGALRP